jgi:hypothetical protein
MVVVNLILLIVGGYLAAGFVFAVPFVIKGVTRIDEGAIGSKWGFRLIIIPGSIIFWPLLLKKWKAVNKQKQKEI